MLKEAYEKYLRKINIPIFNCIFILEVILIIYQPNEKVQSTLLERHK